MLPLLLLLQGLALSLPAAAIDSVEALFACVDANRPRNTSVQEVTFLSTDRMGEERRLDMQVSWQRAEDGLSKVLVRVRAPDDLKRAGLLLIEAEERGADMFVYLPDLDKVKRVTSRMLSGSLFGSDFTYEDFMALQGMHVGGRHELLPEETRGDRTVRVSAHYPAEGSGSAYERVVSYWDKETCLPIESHMYERGDEPRKVLTVDPASVFEDPGARLPQKLVMDDRRDQTSTRLEVSKIEIDVTLPRKTFTSSHLERGR